MLTLANISKHYGAKALYDGVSLQVNRGDRLGLVGPNGAGKSTLFRVILGDIPPDDGEIALQRGITLGYLPQESAPAGGETVLELATAVSEEMAAIQHVMRAHDRPEDAPHPLAETERREGIGYHEAVARFGELDGYRLEPQAKRLLAGLAFRESDFNRHARELSGGWIMRAHLARLLVMEPDLLMLDEPTNHLDLETVGWFQDYLAANFPGAILMISHDREFLNTLCAGIVDIRRGKVTRYDGNYDTYLLQREERDARHRAAYDNQQRQISQMRSSAEKFRAKARRASQAQQKLKQIERMDKLEAPEADEKTINFRFPQPARSALKVATLSQVDQAYGETPVYRGLDFAVERGERIVLVGPNGAGKSTLLKILAGTVPIQDGRRDIGPRVELGYFAQQRAEQLEGNNSVLEEAMAGVTGYSEEEARSLLGCFLFRGDDVFKKVAVLSGGEKSRLALVKLLLHPPNFMLLDEPTTHLDIPSVEALIAALRQYEGTLMFISHDVYFIRQLARRTVHISAGELTSYAGGYDYYLERTGARNARAALVAGERLSVSDARADRPAEGQLGSGANAQPARRRKTKEEKRREAEERARRSQAQKEQQSRVRELESEIERLETRQKEITAQLEDPALYEAGGNPVALSRELEEIEQRLTRATAEWEAAAEAIA
ncbi:MAG: ABC-F family ATP-binding cassette domain-containing protein [Verrucomicrobiota bacterium]